MGSDVSKKLKMLRIENGLTQAQVAETLGITQQTYSKYESGTSIDNKIIVKLCEYYGVSADYLLGIENGNKKKNKKNQENVAYVVNDEDLTTIVENVIKKIDRRNEKK